MVTCFDSVCNWPINVGYFPLYYIKSGKNFYIVIYYLSRFIYLSGNTKFPHCLVSVCSAFLEGFCFVFFFCLGWNIVLMWFQLGTFRLVNMNATIVYVIGHHYIRRLKDYCAEIWTGYLGFNSYKYSVTLREWNLFLETKNVLDESALLRQGWCKHSLYPCRGPAHEKISTQYQE